MLQTCETFLKNIGSIENTFGKLISILLVERRNMNIPISETQLFQNFQQAVSETERVHFFRIMYPYNYYKKQKYRCLKCYFSELNK